ncbi:MAG: lytic murein transglycosylase B [Gammaproteobacteria bacterium]
MKTSIFAILCALCAWGSTASAADPRPLDLQREDVRAFISRLGEQHGMDTASVEQALAAARVQPGILEAISRPAEKVKPWYEYREIFLTEERIAAGVEFWREHADLLQRIYRESGVSPSVIAGIIGVETYYGRITGRHRVLDALATLAFEYPPRSSFFTRELEQFFLMTREQSLDPESLTGSYAGAMGLPQFIPSSYRAYAADGDGDGHIDLWTSVPDVLASVANYLSVHGWRADEPVVARAILDGGAPEDLADQGLKPTTTVGALWDAGIGLAGPVPAGRDSAAGLFELEGRDGPLHWAGFNNFYVITRYNRSLMYALAVTQLGDAVAARAVPGDGF